MQLKVIWERKIATITFFILLTLMLVNYFYNVFTYQGTDIIDMYHPMKLLTLSNYSEYGFYLLQYYPLIVIIPAAFSFFADKQSQELIFIQSRVGAHHYYWGKILGVFLVTFFVFTVPFLVEIGLNSLAFPITAMGDPSNINTYELISAVNMYLFSNLYVYSPYLYAVFFTLVFGIFSGILAVFTVAISTFSIKFKVLLFLPVYALLYLLGAIKQLIPAITVETNYFFYLAFYYPIRNSTESVITLFSFMIVVLVISILIVSIKLRKDVL